jgi:(p)ppGpp synthase/HD superfamily hydrolase
MQRFPRLHAALDYAAEAHQNQVRKGTSIAYLSHLLGVASLVIEHGGDEDQAIAGLLHDVLEDCGIEHEAAIGERFGERVLRIVLACTDGTPDASGQKAPWKERKAAYLAHLKSTPNDALLVSACDKLRNARAIATDLASGADVFARFTGGRDGTLWYYRALVDTFAERLGRERALVIELATTVARMGCSPAVGAEGDGGVDN